MDPNAEEFVMIDRTEIIEKSVSDDNNGNATTSELPEPESQPESSAAVSPDSNNNRSNVFKYTREDLLRIKQEQNADVVGDINKAIYGTLFQETGNLDRILKCNLSNRSDPLNNIMPSYGINMPAGRHSYKQRSQDKSRSYHGGAGKSQSQAQGGNAIHISLKIADQSDVKLNTAGENAWKPALLTAGADEPEEEKRTKEILKRFRGTLNKITPQNFMELLKHVKVLEVNTSERLDKCIEIIFEKAIAEPNYASTYAKLAKEIAGCFVIETDQQKNSFKRRLISQCQCEFEKHKDNELVKFIAQRLQEIEDAEDPIKKQELKDKYEEDNFKLRKRATGTVVFIGEMYKGEMLSAKIMLKCINHLLDSTICSEETLECLCKLLSTIGKRLESEQISGQKVSLDTTFKDLAAIADKKNDLNISSRIRFMIQDLIDLRLNNWTPRRVEHKPQTMEEIKNQVMLEQYVSQANARDLERTPSREGYREGGRGGTSNKRGGHVQTEEGWSMQFNKKNTPFKFDMNKIKIPTSEEFKLGPSTIFQNFGSRFNDLKEEDSSGSESSRRTYSGRLSEGTQQNNSNSNRNSFGNTNRGNRGGNRGNSSRNTNNTTFNRFPPSRPDLPIKSSNMPTRKMSAPARPQTDTVAQAPEKPLITNPEETLSTLKKLHRSYQNEEIPLSDVVDKLKSYKIDKQVLNDAYNWIFDQRDKERFQLAEIICECISHNVIMTKDLLDSLRDIMEVAQDLVNDLPLIYQYMAQLLALPLLKRIIHVKDLLEMSKVEIELGNGGTIIKEIFKTFESKYEKQGLTQLYNECDVNFQVFLGDINLEKFLKENVSCAIFT